MLYRYRVNKGVANVALLAGGGTNNPFRYYSAYCVSKIMLMKMCELLDDENKDLNIFIAGPGFVRTKTHFETIRAGKNAGENYYRVKKFMDSGDFGTPIRKIYGGIRWLERQGRKIAGGRNFSIVNDKFGDKRLMLELKKDLNMYKLRRHRNEWS
jgi:NAD(P)-dependent dehydrogenase (short-subunit alcohol dehydrogenase family)